MHHLRTPALALCLLGAYALPLDDTYTSQIVQTLTVTEELICSQGNCQPTPSHSTGCVAPGTVQTTTLTGPNGKPTATETETRPRSTTTKSVKTMTLTGPNGKPITTETDTVDPATSHLSTISVTSVSISSTSKLPPGITGNTVVETTDKSGHHTTVAFFWHCWFCGGGGLFADGIGKSPKSSTPAI